MNQGTKSVWGSSSASGEVGSSQGQDKLNDGLKGVRRSKTRSKGKALNKIFVGFLARTRDQAAQGAEHGPAGVHQLSLAVAADIVEQVKIIIKSRYSLYYVKAEGTVFLNGNTR